MSLKVIFQNGTQQRPNTFNDTLRDQTEKCTELTYVLSLFALENSRGESFKNTNFDALTRP